MICMKPCPEDGEAGDVFSPEERAMLQNILRLRERRVEDVMVPRAEVHAVGLDETLGQVLKEFGRHRAFPPPRLWTIPWTTRAAWF